MNNVFHIHGEINDGVVEKFMKEVEAFKEWCTNESIGFSKTKIKILLNTHGGDTYSGFVLGNFIKHLGPNVEICAVGKVTSIGVFILTSVQGKRSCYENTVFFTDPCQTNLNDHSNITDNEADHLSAFIIRNSFKKRLIEGSREKITEITAESLCSKDNYLTPDKARALGMIDDILW